MSPPRDPEQRLVLYSVEADLPTARVLLQLAGCGADDAASDIAGWAPSKPPRASPLHKRLAGASRRLSASTVKRCAARSGEVGSKRSTGLSEVGEAVVVIAAQATRS